MDKFILHQGVVVPLDRQNVDTDAIIPKQFLKSIKRTGFGEHVFDVWRYLDRGEIGMIAENRTLNPDFVLNQSRYHGASILLTRKNFGCGSSREHAPWALQQFGFKAILAPSFADIFYNNCFKSALLPIVLDEAQIEQLFEETLAQVGYQLTIDLEQQCVLTPKGQSFQFEISEFRKYCLLNGLDEIGLTLRQAPAIRDFETKYFENYPWLA